MAPNGPESPSKKRKQPLNQLKRDQPLFASRRAPPTLQQPPDFLTDSLNTSHIPTPSPPKSPTRQAVRSRPRQTLDRKSLAAAFKATPRINNDNQPPSSTSSTQRKRPEQTRKPPPTNVPRRASSNTPSKTAQSRARVRTPTPPRRRQDSIISPTNSESDPPRGYAEAYQRIGEEENLAQEDSIDDMEIETFDYTQDMSQDLDRLRQRTRDSELPVSLRTSRTASPGGKPGDFERVEDDMEDRANKAHDSDGESGISYVENNTESSIDSGSSQYARDKQRLNGALKSGGKAFSKARLGERVGLTVENLRRKNGSIESLESAFSTESINYRGSDPSVNIPRAWGRKAKPGKDWLNRINSRSGRLTGDVPKRHASGDDLIAKTEDHKDVFGADGWVVAAAKVPLPKNEGNSSQTGSSQASTPTTVQGNSPLDRRRFLGFNDEDFTARSLQVSESPPIRIPNATLDRMRDREMEHLEKRAVTSNRLEELREQRFEERKSPSRSAEDVTWHNSSRRLSSDKLSTKPKVLDKTAHDATLENPGEPIPDSPVVIYRTTTEQIDASGGKNSTKVAQKNQSPRRPSLERRDSHDLLKRLARATSASPSPAKGPAEEEIKISPAEGRVQVEQTPQVSRSSSNLKTPVVTGAWIEQSPERTSHTSMPNAILKTPFVTGAWIDTPLPTGGRGPPMPTPSGLDEDRELSIGKSGAKDLIHRLSPNTNTTRPNLRNREPLQFSGPPIPKSALEEIITEAKSTDSMALVNNTSNSDSEEDPTLHLGESTIASLEELIANDTDFSTLLAPTPESLNTSPRSSDPSPSSSNLLNPNPPKISGLAVPQSYTRLLQRITDLAPSIRDSKKQLASLERAVSAAPPTDGAVSGGDCNEAGEFHDFIWPCQKCGCPGRMEPDLAPLFSLRDNVTSIKIPIPKLWTWKKDDWRPRLTWLGVATLLAWMALFGEGWARYVPLCFPPAWPYILELRED